MTRREREGLIYLPEAALTLRVSWVVFEKALYHPTVSPHLTRRYRKRWGHPRRVRVLTPADCERIMAYLFEHAHVFRPIKAIAVTHSVTPCARLHNPRQGTPRQFVSTKKMSRRSAR